MKRDPLGTMLTNTYTKSGLLRRVRLLRSFLEQTYFTDEKNGVTLETYLKDRGEDEADIHAIRDWGKAIEQAFSKHTLYKKYERILQEIESLPVITLFLPFAADDEHVASLGAWFRKNVDEKMLINARFDENAAGGCCIAYEGNYVDYSASYYIKKNRSLFLDLLKTYET